VFVACSEDALAGITHAGQVGLKRFEELNVDEVAESRVLASVRELLGNGMQLLGDLPTLREHQDDIRPGEPDRPKVRPGDRCELLLAGVQWCDLQLKRGE